jgi:hypothetical protein
VFYGSGGAASVFLDVGVKFTTICASRLHTLPCTKSLGVKRERRSCVESIGISGWLFPKIEICGVDYSCTGDYVFSIVSTPMRSLSPLLPYVFVWSVLRRFGRFCLSGTLLGVRFSFHVRMEDLVRCFRYLDVSLDVFS